MAPSTVEKYERILQADPRSRIFVELARALLEAGGAERAVEVCQRGLEHHPDSVLARVLWGKALLALGRSDEAIARFGEALAADPANPYGCDLVGEALVKNGLAARALPLMEQAATLHPGDGRIRRWLEEARQASAGPAPLPDPPPASGGRGPELSIPTPTPSVSSASPWKASGGRGPEPSIPTPTPGPPPLRADARPPPILRSNRVPEPEASAASRFLDSLPDVSAASRGAAARERDDRPRPSAGRDEEREASEVASTYEHELREKLLADPVPQQGFVRRHAAAATLVAIAVAIAAGAATFVAVRKHRRADEARAAVEDARKGLARDTSGSLREAARVLDGARRAAPANAAAAALAAEVSGVLAYDFGDAGARSAARELLATGGAGEGALAARWLVADREGERGAAAEALLDGAARGTPLARALAGELLVARHDLDGARPHLEAAARASPPLLRALATLGDLELARGDAAAALDRYALVLRAHPTHPRAAIGAAEARLRLGRDLPEALHTLEAVEADESSATPLSAALRMDLALSRLLAATGRVADAEQRLAQAASRQPAEAEISAVQADVFARAGDLDRALRAAEGAVRLAPGSAAHRELVARLQLRHGRYRELLAATEGAPTRTLRLYRGIARLALGEANAARGELEGTRRDGKMTPEAAAWMALAELAAGHRAQASRITAVLLAAPSPHPVALVARGRLDAAAGRLDSAERRFRDAVGRDPELVDAQCDLGRVLVQRGRAAEARDVLEKAVARNPYHLDARLELGRARLGTGDAAGAARELEAVVKERPKDLDAWLALSGARLAAGAAAEARSAAERALGLDPKSAAAALAAGRAALAQGAPRDARPLLERAVKLGGKTPPGREARHALAALKRR